MLNQLRVRWENLRLRAKALLVVGIPVLALLIVTTSAYLAQRQQADAEREAERSLEISRSIQELLTLLVDAETGVRGFLLTGDGEWLAPHEAAVRRLPGALDGLAALIAEPVQQERLQRVRSLIERRRVTWDELRAVRGASLGSESVQGPLARGKV
ncbi:MAG: CHASE3 domain-containing protein, partial [Chloroflexi bacterium]|nr:CHASE3 domain-containing protein [Chloroflexota bacterium]